jgi:hypothetical protein
MGWTHYWKRSTELPPEKFAAAVRDCRKLLPALGIPLAGIDGNGIPHLADDGIAFNGVPSCERFEIHQTEFDRRGRAVMWGFCKTEKLPYDLCVQAALIVLKHHLGDAIVVNSDGTENDWSAAPRTIGRRRARNASSTWGTGRNSDWMRRNRPEPGGTQAGCYTPWLWSPLRE